MAAQHDAVDPQNQNTESSAQPRSAVHHIRLPGFIMDDDEIGLGDAIKRATSYVGLRPCGGCARRAETFNRWLGFTR